MHGVTNNMQTTKCLNCQPLWVSESEAMQSMNMHVYLRACHRLALSCKLLAFSKSYHTHSSGNCPTNRKKSSKGAWKIRSDLIFEGILSHEQVTKNGSCQEFLPPSVQITFNAYCNNKTFCTMDISQARPLHEYYSVHPLIPNVKHTPPPPKLTARTLNIDGWKMSFILGPGLFSGAFAVKLQGRVLTYWDKPINIVTGGTDSPCWLRSMMTSDPPTLKQKWHQHVVWHLGPHCWHQKKSCTSWIMWKMIEQYTFFTRILSVAVG